MTWRLGPEPLTTERTRPVHTDDGRNGWVSIRHVGGRPQPYGGIWSVPDGECWDDGSPVEGECLDLYPTFA